MPRININEKDNTSPGTPGGYSNNTVLIAGFSKRTNEEIIAAVDADKTIGYTLPDDNGIFEFTSADAFEKTIGKVAPNVVETPDDTVTAKLPMHYGNQMAYELLQMGYPIIYINLGAVGKTKVKDPDGAEKVASVAELMQKLTEEDTWAIFKDKASYDFRFVTHGLLTSKEEAKSDDLVKLENRVAKMREFLPVFNTETDRKDTDVKDLDGNPVPETDLQATCRIYAAAVVKENKYLTDKNTKAERESIGYTQSFIKLSGVTEEQILEEATDGYGYGYHQANINIAAEEAKVKAALDATDPNSFSDTDFNDANTMIANLAAYVAQPAPMDDEMAANSGRGDCVALIEVDESKYISGEGRPETRIIEAINEMGDIGADNGKYCACTVPSVVYSMSADKDFGYNKKLPGAFHYLACYDNSIGLGFAEWYAVAGYTRGVSSYVIDHTSVKLGEIAIQALEPRNLVDDPQKTQPKFAVNVIANFRGSYYLWGNRTCHQLGSAAGGNDLVASHFLNIRQLCTTIKKQLYVSCRRFTFDPNSETLWVNFYNSITPMLNRMRADQGIRSYEIERIYTDKKATVKARIRIVPIEAVEDFILEIALEDSLGEAAVTVTE